MLTITVQGLEMWDEEKERFLNEESFQLDLEHSLISLSKWESKFEKAFLSDSEKSQEEMLWYIYFMIIPPGVALEKLSMMSARNLQDLIPFEKLARLSAENLKEINEYIDSKQTATTFREEPKKKGRPEKITAELIYYWMLSFNIPAEFKFWHLNQLFALIRIFGIKQSKPTGKKVSRQEMAENNRRLNEERRARLGTNG